MLKDKKMMFFLLAANTMLSAGVYGENLSNSKHEKLYNNMVKNLETGKSNDSNYKIIESVLKSRNKELKDLYAQSDYIVKPEYLEWQIFASGFYSERDRGYDSDKGNGSNEKNSMQTNGTDLRSAKQVQIGASIPIKAVNDFILEPEININKKEITVDSIQAPTVVPKIAPTINIPIVNLPTINVTQPSAVVSPQVVSPDININTNVTIPQVVLSPITVVSFGLPFFNSTSPVLSHVFNQTSYTGTYTLTGGSTLESILTLSAPGAGISMLRNNPSSILTTQKENTRIMEIDQPVDTSLVISNQGILNLQASMTVGMEGRGPSAFNLGSSSLVQDHNSSLYNEGIINGLSNSTGTLKNQAALSVGMDGSVPGTKVLMANTTTGKITMNAPESVGIQLRPDASLIVQQGVNEGEITINGKRSYGMMTTDSGTGTGFLNQDPAMPNGTSSLGITATGIINVNGDESTGFAILVPINEWGGIGTINIGIINPNQDPINGNLHSSVNLVERATGLYSNQPNLTVTCISGTCGNAEMMGPGSINIGSFAYQSSGARAEGKGVIGNTGTINVNGDNNYGAVIIDQGLFNNHIWTPLMYTGKLNVNSDNSIGVFVNNQGRLWNESLIVVNGNNSIGLIQKNGESQNLGFSNNSTAYGRGDGTIETNGQNAHTVILTKDNPSLASSFYNTGIIKNNSEGTIGIYAEKEAEIFHLLESVADPLAQTAKIQSGNGAIGIYTKDSGTKANIGALIATGNSTTKTSIAVMSDGNSVTEFNNIAGTNKQAKINLGTGAIGLYSIDGTKFSNTFVINGLETEIGNSSVLAYVTESNTNISNLDNIKVRSMGTNSVLLYGANYSDIIIDSNLSVPMSGGTVSSSSQVYVAENSKVTLNAGKTLESNTKTGLSAFSQNGKSFRDGTPVAVNKLKTGVINKGTVIMNSSSSVGLYTLYGTSLNDTAGIININSTAANGVGMYAEEEAEIENKGTINLNASNAVGIYGKGDSSALYSSLNNINIINSGSINLNGADNIGISADNNKSGALVSDAVITNNASGVNKIFVNGNGSVGIYAPFSTVNQNGNIKLAGNNTVGVYGTNGAVINGGGVIELNTTNQSQIAYYLEGNATKLTGSLGDITGHGIAVLSDGAVIDNSIPVLDLTTSGFSDGGAGKIALVLQGASTFGYIQDIKVGDSVDINSDGIPDHYAVALYTDNQNLSSGIANNLTAGENGVGLYAQNGSNIKYSGTINVGNNTTGGTGVYVGSNSGTGSSVALDNAIINLNGAGGIGVYVENLSTLTFEANSVMNFSGDGVGIYGVQGSIINDNGGVINSNGYAVERTRIQGGIINVSSNINVSGGSILGHAVNGEINVIPGVTVTASGDDVIGIFGDGLKAPGVWTQPYEANNLGTIDFSSSNKATGIYLNNARGENKGTIKVKDNSIAFYGQGAGSELYNNALIEIGSSSVGLYGNNADIAENLSGTIKGNGTSNTGIYNIRTTPGSTAVSNGGVIELGSDGIGIYAENSMITNTGSITVGDKSTKNSLGIYAKNSTLTDSGNIKVGNSGIAYYGDNSTLNLNSAGTGIDIANNGVLAYGINNTVINYNLGNKSTSENTFVYLINSSVDFNGAEITVSKNGLGVYQEGISSTQGYNKLIIKENGAGIYGYQTNLTNTGDIVLTEKNSVGIIAEDSNVINNTLKTIKTMDSGTVGIYSVLKNTVPLQTVDNNGEIDILGDRSIGIYGNTLDNAGFSLGTIEILNNNIIKLGSASDINNAAIGIYGTKGVEIKTISGSTINGGNNTVGIYSDKGKIDHKGTIDVKDGSVGIYASGSTADVDSSSVINVGNNGAVALYVNSGGVLTNDSSNINVGNDSIIGYSKDNGTLLDNRGNLSIGTESVAFYSSGGEIKNSGILTSSGDGVIFFYGNSGKITNSGRINGSGNGYGVGIYGKDSEISNTADIYLGDSNIINPSDPSDSKNRYSVGIYGDSSKIYNNGDISVGESGIGIYSYRQSGDLINDTNALITSNKDKAIGILAEVGKGQKVINKGEIDLSGKESIGIALNNGVILENSGKIQVTGDQSIGIMATKDSEIYNSGVINASGNESIAVLLKSNSKLVNTGTINLGSGALGVVADNDSSVDGYGKTSLETTSVKIPSIANVPSYKPPTITNAGIIKVGAKFEVPYDGVVQVKVDPDSVRTPTSDEVSVSDLGAKFLVSNAVKFIAPEFSINDVTITSDFTQGTSAKTYKLQDVFMPSEPGGGINSGIATILSQSYTWDATPVTNSNGNVDIWMQKIEYADLLDGYWNEEFAGALDSKYENATGDALKIFNKIDRLENERDFKHIMSSLAGNIYANINQRENDIANVFENSLDLLESSKNNTKENVKVNIIGGKGRTKEDTDGVIGYDYITTGVLALREVERTYKQTFGYSLGYLHTGFEFKDNNESEEWVDTIQLGVHNKYTVNNWKLRNDLTGRVSFHNIDRNLDWPSPNNRSEMNGSYETYSITSDNILGKEIGLGKNSSITPYGALRAMYVTRPTFSESGLEALEVEGNNAWSVKPRAGIALETGIPLGSKNGWQLKGKLDLAYEYELANLNEREKARLIAIEDGYHNLAKPEEEKGQFKTRAAIGFEVNERYGLFLNGEYSLGDHDQDEYRAGFTVKAVF